MKKGIIMGILLVLACCLPAAAEFYRYKDAHGNVIYTDDISKVPLEQRKDVESYDEHISRPQIDSDESPSENNDLKTEIEGDDKKESLRLKKIEAALAKEHDGLTAERNALDKEKEAAVTKAQIKTYNQKVVEFNARLKAYEEKRKAHNAEVKEYNKRLEEKESNNPSQ